MDESDLVRRAQRGDVDAYEALIRRYQPVAQRAAYLVTQHRADAEDAVQEAFVKAWYALDSFRTGSPFRPWLLRIVTNEAHDRQRAASRRARLALKAAETTTPHSTEPSPEARSIEQERAERVIQEINTLPEMDRLIVTYRYFLDLPTAEVAEITGTPAGTVRSRLSRALSRLRQQLTANESSEHYFSNAEVWKKRNG